MRYRRGFWEWMTNIVIGLFAVSLVINGILKLLAPYVAWLILGGLAFLIARMWYGYSRNW